MLHEPKGIEEQQTCKVRQVTDKIGSLLQATAEGIENGQALAPVAGVGNCHNPRGAFPI